ncbi:MAG TPA: hypothetical protein VJT82_04660, partial [Pyrinomonadaceae bacterium]|nr:hypothetical protein [Pyrinomonadaceae bacterium]
MKLKFRRFPRPVWFLTILITAAVLYISLEVYLQHFSNQIIEGHKKWFELGSHILVTIIVVSSLHLLDQFGLWKEVREENRLTLDALMRKQSQLLDSSAICGITNIYATRHAARTHFKADIENAKERVWLLGVGLNVTLDLENLISLLREKHAKKVDVRILMLDAVRSTAVFRTLLESDPEIAQRIIDIYTTSPPDHRERDVYFNQRLCRKFESTCKSLYDVDELRDLVRFYAHTPICWLVITDHTVYFQPYTFGSRPNNSRKSTPETPEASPTEITQADEDTIGDLMPVFKFQDGDKCRPFKVLEDHFKKLWATSDTDLFHIRARQEAKDSLVQKIFAARGAWLEQVNGVLYNNGGRNPCEQTPGTPEYREYPRQACPSDVRVTLRAANTQNALEFSAKILDFSREGIGLKGISYKDNLLKEE